MGLRLPIYPYYVGKGKPAASKKRNSHFNDVARETLEAFETYLSHPGVKRLAENVIFDSVKPRGRWFRTHTFDKDRDEHPKLLDLLNAVGKKGTILIPDITHITGSREKRTPRWKLEELVDQIADGNIEILPLVLKIKNGPSYDLRKIVDSGRPDPTVFELMPEIAMATTEHLKRFIRGQKRVRRIGAGRNRKPLS
jgi:hypothetical protein